MRRQGILVIAVVLLGVLLFLVQEGLAQKVTQYWWEREGKEQPFPYPGSPEVEAYFRTRGSEDRGVVPGDYIGMAKVKAVACIVLGTVKEIKSNPRGPYHTWVTISVERYLKGGSDKKEVLVKLISGKTEDGGGIHSTADPDIQEGERVVLFLTDVPFYLHNHAVAGGVPDYRNVTECKGYFEFAAKYSVEGDTIIGRMARKQGGRMVAKRARVSLNQFVQDILSALEVKGGQDEEREVR